MIESLLYGIAWIFEKVLFLPYDLLRFLEDDSWWLANIITWVCLIVLCLAFYYWMKQLKIFNDNNEEDRSVVAHSFLG